ncbi:Uncharacterised protein [Mycobacteroides abscessus subsp. bolletii]|uniref:hypothetical protein n=1 Tax=Mycobacteroides abscessus TaxID=36809 RepID=UPI00092C0DF7|nr:hypothetical protein [Mycobacteroides abscessus]SIJ51605.1 Uncharacterised protein [Mycobacteroides abscessus subsp. bolletii]SLD45884.1 Uncharacterised protein [Mycobacteroides abscessus subsp. bolletii]SLE35618.1 Uncharacterised protein [Mycobacteroides abscessus subsp. bolletii]
MTSTGRILQLVAYERIRQQDKWGEQNHPGVHPVLIQRPGGCTTQRMAQEYEIPTANRARFICQCAAECGEVTWGHILIEEVAEAIEAATLYEEALQRGGGTQPTARRLVVNELVQVAAVAVQWAEKLGGTE